MHEIAGPHGKTREIKLNELVEFTNMSGEYVHRITERIWKYQQRHHVGAEAAIECLANRPAQADKMNKALIIGNQFEVMGWNPAHAETIVVFQKIKDPQKNLFYEIDWKADPNTPLEASK